MTGRRRYGAAASFAWGALWGSALGAWLLAGRIVAFYRLHPTTAAEWLHLDVALLFTFAVLGSLAGFFGAAPLVVWTALRRRPLADPSLAHAIGGAALVPLAYLAAAVALEGVSPALPAETSALGEVVAAAAAALAVVPVLVQVYRRAAGRPVKRRMAVGLSATAVTGLLSLPLRAPIETFAAPPDAGEAPARLRPAAPLLFVAVDGGNWRTLRPLLERGSLPALARLAREGTTGEVEALWPPFWSTPAWATILTGYPQSETGVYAELAGRIPGVPGFQVPLTFDLVLEPVSVWALLMTQTGVVELSLAPRTELRRPPFWEILARAGLKAAVVRLYFSYPASGPAAYVVSNGIGDDVWGLLGMQPTSAPDAVWPREELARMRELFSHPESPGDFASVLALEEGPRPRDARIHPATVLRAALRIDQRAVAAARMLLAEHSDLDVVGIYLGGFDTVSHAFWQYRFPQDFPQDPPDVADVAAFGDVIDRYWSFLDGAVGELEAAFATRPNVMVIADHGEEASHGSSMWRAWHSRQGGVFLAAGPGVPRSTAVARVAYLDVTPTVLDLAGVGASPDMVGSSFLARPRDR